MEPPLRLERVCFFGCLRSILGCSVGSGAVSATFLRPSMPLAEPLVELPFAVVASSPGAGWFRYRKCCCTMVPPFEVTP